METVITALLDGVLVPLIAVLTAPLPWLASSGALFVVFGALWLALGVAIVRDPTRVEGAWHRLRALPLLVQAVAWLLFLPVLAGVWVWRTAWPTVARAVVVVGIAGWNLLVFLPRPA